jgi:L-aspartate oxidase
MSRTEEFDAVIVGSGIAGLRAAVELAGAGRRTILVTKDDPTQSNTGYAQGGIAAALAEDDRVELHLEDTLRAGDGLCDERAVRVLVEEGPERIRELIDWGTRFDREAAGLALAREAAHSRRRVIHAGGDSTGMEIVRALLARARRLEALTILASTFSVDLILRDGRCAGILLQDEASGEVYPAYAGSVLLATGGAGRLFRDTTNPPQATGDGMAMGYRAGAAVCDLEFVQFHPTVLCAPGAPPFLLSEALRGEGAILRNAAGERFMSGVHPDAEMAPRDVVARGIVEEMARTGAGSVFLDLTGRDRRFLEERFPRITRTLASFGFDLSRDRVPVRPAAHYMMGGLQTDLDGRTSVPGLFAAGEVACTGVHGANRLASNSLLEGVVFGARAAAAMLREGTAGSSTAGKLSIPKSVPSDQAVPRMQSLGDLMAGSAGVRRSGGDLERALARLREASEVLARVPVQRAGVEARNLLLVGELVVASALERQESRGAHFRSDFPVKRAEWRRHLARQAPPAEDLPGFA